MLVSSIIFTFLVADITDKFLSDTTLIEVSKKEHFVGEIPFPAVTVCPDVKIPEDFYNRVKSQTNFTSNEQDIFK